MQVSVETTSSLGRRLTVSVPPEQIEAALQKRLQKLMQTAKIEGFRPGKAPKRVVEQRYGASIRSEVIDELLQTTLNDAVKQEKLQPAAMPHIQSFSAEPGQAMRYVVAFEILPEVKLQNMSDVNLEKLVVDITDADVDTVLEQMRKQHVKWHTVNRPAQMGDRLTLDLNWINADETLQKREQKNVSWILEHGVIPPELEVLKGVKAGDEVKVEIPVHGADDKKTHHPAMVKIHSVAEPQLPELNDAFAKTLEVRGGMEELRAEVQKHMEHQLGENIKNRLKNQMMEKLLERYKLELPAEMVQAEIKRLEQEFLAQLGKDAPKEILTKLPETVRDNMKTAAERRVTLSLVYGALIKEHGLTVDKMRLRNRIEHIAMNYQDPRSMVDMMYADKNIINGLSSQVLEEQILEKLLEKVQYTEKTAAYAEVMNMNGTSQQAMAHPSSAVYMPQDDLHDHDHANCDHDHDHAHCDHDH